MAIGVSPDFFNRAVLVGHGVPPWFLRTMLLLVTGAALVAGFAMTDAAATNQSVALAGPDLARLMRGMAVIKLLMAVVCMAAVLWRLAVAVTAAWLAAYILACGIMAAGPGLIWDMSYVRTGALLLHGGLFTTILLLWRDPVVGARLAALVAARKMARGAGV